MILEKNNLYSAMFKRLIDFLEDYEGNVNFCAAADIVSQQEEYEPVLIDENKYLWHSLSPFCKLVNVKSSYEVCGHELLFHVVVEIPDRVKLAWVQKGSDLEGCQFSEPLPYDVDAGKFLVMLSAIFEGEDPEEALKRLAPRT